MLPPNDHEIVVVSDLHLGFGPDPRTGRYHRHENFFFDEEFASFCAYLVTDAEERDIRLLIILNGDVFDFLKSPDPAPAVAGDARDPARDRPDENSADVCARKLRRILRGHPGFVGAIAGLAQVGHEVMFLPGNHDIELQVEEVRQELLSAIERALPAAARADALARVRIERWFYYEEGRVWIEHGSQYDRFNAFLYWLKDTLPASSRAEQVDFPFGSFFQRYLFNRLGALTFVVPTPRANAEYLRWLVAHNPRRLLKATVSYAPFALRVLAEYRRAKGGEDDDLRRAHEQKLAVLARESGLKERLHKIDGLGVTPVKKAEVVFAALWRGAGYVAMGTLATLMMLTLFLSVADIFDDGGVLARIVYRIGLLLVVFVLTFVAGAYLLVRAGRHRPTLPTDPFRDRAREIAKLVRVRNVVFGHSHQEDVEVIDQEVEGGRTWDAVYFNTGTWIPVFDPGSVSPRERIQHTFLRIEGQRGALWFWDPERRAARRAVLLEEEE